MRKNYRFAGLFRHFLGVLLLSIPAYGQLEPIPKDYYLLPVYPGQANTLSGTLGDLRAGHFHAGIDVRTQRKEGLPVTAAADGYISRILVQTGGYGKGLYVEHPNGTTTVYGHLKNFSPEIDRIARKAQYENESFEVNLAPKPDSIPVKKGQLIAISGNTGSSEGPHLHFEIRDAQGNYLNPLLFHFPEIKDATPPRFVSFALQPMNIDSRVNGKIDRQAFYPVQKSGAKSAVIADTIYATGTLGLELQAFDRMDGTGFNYGLHCIEVRVDSQEVFSFNLETLPTGIGREYFNLINYSARVRDSERYLKCYRSSESLSELFRTNDDRGKLIINDNRVRIVEIRIYDSFENWSELKFVVKGESNGLAEVSLKKQEKIPAGYEVSDHVLKISSDENSGLLYVKGQTYPIQADYQDGPGHVFLVDLTQTIPDSVSIGTETHRFDFVSSVPAGQDFSAETKGISLKIPAGSLFETLYLRLSRMGDTLQIIDYTQPLKSSIEVAFVPDSTPVHPEKTHIYRREKGRESFVGGTWQGSEFRFNTTSLGTFYPRTDLEPPVVRLLESSPGRIRAQITDQQSGIATFRARVDRKWVLMNYEYKNGQIWSEKLDDSVPFEGELELEVSDRAGNVTRINAPIAERVRQSPRRR